MKKRTVSIIVVMILLVSMLSGCGLITLNAERDGAQVVSTVEMENGLKSAVTKVDVINTFNQLGYMYIQYYGWTVDKIITEFVDQLSNKEVLVLNAITKIAEDKGINIEDVKAANNAYVANLQKKGTNKYNSELRPYDLFNMFDPDEQLYVIKETKKSLNESFKTLVAEVDKEFAANAPEKEEEDKTEEDKKPSEEEEKQLEPRTKKTPATSEGFKKDASITAETVANEPTFFAEMDKKLNDGELNKVETEAYDRLKKNILKNYSSVDVAWNAMLDSQKEARLLVKFQDDYINAGIVADADEILSRYNYTISKNLTSVFDEDSYKTAIEADKTNDLLVHNNKTSYFTVKSILLQFSEKQKKALEAIKAGVLGDTDDKQMIVESREKLAIDKNFSIPGVAENIGGIKVNVSNPDYDPNAVCKDENCECVACKNNANYKKGNVCTNKDCKCVACKNSAYARRDVDFIEILNEMSTALKNAENVNVDAIPEDQRDAARLNAKMDVFDDYIYLVNDDPGMFNSTGYIINSDGKSTYVGEYVTLARELAKTNTIGAVGNVAEKAEGYENLIDKKEPNVMIHQYVNPNGGAPINYIVNDFGIHIVMVTYAVNDAKDTTVIEGEQYRLNDNYIVKYENAYKRDDEGKLVMDAAGNKIVTEVKNLTVNAKLAEAIKNEKKSDNYIKEEKKITDANKNSIKKNDKLIKNIISEIEKQVGKLPTHDHEGHNH